MIQKKIVIRILAVYTLAVIFLPIFSFNFPQSIFFLRSLFFVIPMWIFVILWLLPKLYTSKYFMVFIIFGFLYYVGIGTIWSERIVMGEKISFIWFLRDIFGAYLAVLMYVSFFYIKDFKGLSAVSLLALFFILATAITSIIGINLFPGVVRVMATSEGAGDMQMFYRKIGIADYSLFASLIFLMPALIFYIKDVGSKMITKIIVILIILIFVFSLYKSEFTTALILSVILVLMSLISNKNMYGSILIISLITIVSLLFLNNYIANLFYYISYNFAEGTIIARRLVDVGQIFELADYTPGSEETYFTRNRLSLSMESFNAFILNPIVGTAWGGGHATWLDRLGAFGILGFLPWIIIFKQQISLNSSLLETRTKVYYYLTIFGCIFLGLITTQANSIHTLVVIFFVIPGLLLNANNSKKYTIVVK
jgi:hypothetical protein